MNLQNRNNPVVSDSLQPHELYSSWNSPSQNTGAGRCSLLQGILPTQGWNPGLPQQVDSLPAEPPGKSLTDLKKEFIIMGRRVEDGRKG